VVVVVAVAVAVVVVAAAVVVAATEAEAGPLVVEEETDTSLDLLLLGREEIADQDLPPETEHQETKRETGRSLPHPLRQPVAP